VMIMPSNAPHHTHHHPQHQHASYQPPAGGMYAKASY